MKLRSLALLTSAAVLATMSSTANAAVTIFDFTGRVETVTDAQGNPSINTDAYLYTNVNGSFKFDPDLLPTSSTSGTDSRGSFVQDQFPALTEFTIDTAMGGGDGSGNFFAIRRPWETLVELMAFNSGLASISIFAGTGETTVGSSLANFEGFANSSPFWSFRIESLEYQGNVDVLTGFLTVTARAPQQTDPTPPVTSAVPEPASWALMIGGFGMIGAAMRRRQRTTVRFA